MANIYLGKVNANESKKGNVFYKGFICNVPVVGFVRQDDDGNDVIHFNLDAGYVAWKDEQEDDRRGSGGGSRGGSRRSGSRRSGGGSRGGSRSGSRDGSRSGGSNRGRNDNRNDEPDYDDDAPF